MKYFTTLLLLFISLNYCVGQNSEIIKVKFSSTTPRSGYTYEIELSANQIKVKEYSKRTPDNVILIKDGNNLNWDKQQELIKTIDLAKVADLQSPTNKRAVDGAKHSSIILYDSNGKEFIHLFDDENPHELFTKLLVEINKMAKSD